MKKIVFALAVVALFAGHTASAHIVINPETGLEVPHLHPENGNPMLLTMPWGLTGEKTPLVAPGTVVKDESGFEDLCPSWFPRNGCFNITGTEYYRTRMIDMAKQLVSIGKINQFPQFAYWSRLSR